MKPRTHFRYHQKNKDGKILHSGITKNPEQRDQQHQTRWPGSHLSVQGPRVTEESARKWEETKHKSINPPRNPKK